MITQAEDIRNENLIRKKWNFEKKDPKTFPDGILLTGANSFIGSHIVKLLQEKYPGKLFLILRAPAEKDAVNKMQQAFNQWGLGEFDNSKVKIYLGDVSLNMMNLSNREFKEIREETGRVLHLAMTPLYHLPYRHFKRVWVPELERMISFCGDPRAPKILHYASSYNANFFVRDSDFSALNTNAWQSGYAGFKWVANQAIRNAMGQGLKACIYDIPLVIGSEKNGLCPAHYSIWHILDIFLKTGYYFKFCFRVIPVDILADIMVYNILKEDEENSFSRPILQEAVTDTMFTATVANILGLREEKLPIVREACQNKLRFDFMMPPNFYDLLEKVNHLPAIFPAEYDPAGLPHSSMVFMSNLNRILAKKNEDLLVR